MNYFYSDPHFGHYNVIIYSNRPFLHTVEDNHIFFNGDLVKTLNTNSEAIAEARKMSVKLMEETLVSKWNAKVTNDDTVYVVGDFAFASTEEITRILSRLNGTKILIEGNHDSSKKVMISAGFKEVHDTLKLTLGGTEIILSHYPYVDPSLNEIAKLRPNIMKINTTATFLPEIPDSFNYEESKEILKKIYKYPINLKLDPDKKYFNYIKRAISAHIGTRLVNEGKILGHGHTHHKEKINGNMINFCLEARDYSPVSETDLITEINLIKEELKKNNN